MLDIIFITAYNLFINLTTAIFICKLMNEIIKNLKKHSPRSVLEFGFGSGYLTRLIRKAYPNTFNTFFTGIDKNPNFIKDNIITLFDEYFCEDILSLNIKHKFDLIVLGNPRIPFWWIYNCYTIKSYTEIIKRLVSLLEENGSLFFIVKTYKNCTQKSEILFKEYQDFLLIDASEKEYPPNLNEFINTDIINLTKKLLIELGIIDVDVISIKDTEKCIYPEEPCKNAKIKITRENLKKAANLDCQISRFGLSYGYYDILTAKNS
ncbi:MULTISPECIES: methyltransferase [unclassified Treponema]|uniref:methyltransferase n=1 Tax=unclassified Treponema TaxID=2638727 RepID=UPI0020A273E8|nr:MULTISPECIES: methyltransferase [unclassified Treponema]UTC66527.1 methyltransferase [Treponema sp. OMZ 789]UTC69259.1 methyltransferase [Treponema sp. OMZ 790]UTC71972.1 methyltransferase [Treponema sp. OMZ 791]